MKLIARGEAKPADKQLTPIQPKQPRGRTAMSKQMTPEEREKAIKRKPWKFCRKCKCDIKSPTQYCYDCYTGHNFTASPYGLINANKAFKFVPSENR